MTSSPRPNWYGVQCVFAVGWPPEAAGKTYEERITLWQAETADEALERAEAEALEYDKAIDEGRLRISGWRSPSISSFHRAMVPRSSR